MDIMETKGRHVPALFLELQKSNLMGFVEFFGEVKTSPSSPMGQTMDFHSALEEM